MTLENKILKSYSKKSRIAVKSSTEIEIFAVYQAMNLILSCYIKKSGNQTFCIHTDCAQVPTFFENTNKKIKIFKDNENIKRDMLKTYQEICQKIEKDNGKFSLKWIARDLNKKAHKETYKMLKRIRKISNVNSSKDDVLIRKETFCELLANSNKNQIAIIIYLLKISNEDGVLFVTQKTLAEILDMPIATIRKTLKQLSEWKVIERVKNGKYLLLI